MIELVSNEHKKLIMDLFESANDSIKIISPFLSRKTTGILCEAAKRGVNCTVITRMYLQDFLDGSNTLDGLQEMLDAGVSVMALIGLHTKLYLFDDCDAIVGSANFTEGGLSRNIELSIHFKQEENVLVDLNEYFASLASSIKKAEDGIVNQKMLDEYQKLYKEHKQSKGLTGGIKIVSTVRGAALDRKARSIKNELDAVQDEIQSHLDERNADVVYMALEGNGDKITHKNLKNIILKFAGSAKDRYDGAKPMDMKSYSENGKRFYITNFSTSREKSAAAVQDLDETFFCIHSYDKSGKACPIIVGKGTLREYSSSNDARKKAWFNQYTYLAEYPYYCVINEAKVIDAPVNCGIPLREVTDVLGANTYMHTIKHPEQYTLEKLAGSHRQQVMLYLTPDAKQYLDERLEALGEQYGWRTYISD